MNSVNSKNSADNPSQVPRGNDGLRVYTEEFRDRSAPPYFAGRETILLDIEKSCVSIWQRHQSNQLQIEGSTRIIYGAPGAGKSSLLKHLRHAWQQDHFVSRSLAELNLNEPTPAMLFSGAGTILDLETMFCKKLADVVEPGSGNDMFAATTKTLRKTFGASFSLIDGRIEVEKMMELPVADAVLETVAELLPPCRWRRPVVIAIDEVQNMFGDAKARSSRLLQALHTNDQNLPILVVLAGLSNSSMRVKELGLSRLSVACTFPLESLNAIEIEDLKTGFCNHFDIDLKTRSRELDSLLIGTDGWPSHIQNCMQAFGQGYLSAGGDIDSIDFLEVEKLSQSARMEYYHARMSDAMKESCSLLSMLMDQLNKEMNRGQILSIIKQIDRQNQGGDDFTLMLPDYMTVSGFYADLVHCGALQERDKGTVFCPIPSFRQFMVEFGKTNSNDNIFRDAPHHFGFTWDALQRIESAHKIQDVN